MEAEFQSLRNLVALMKQQWEFELIPRIEAWRKWGHGVELFGYEGEGCPSQELRKELNNDNPAYHLLQTAIREGSYEFPELELLFDDEENLPPGFRCPTLSDFPFPKRVATKIELAAEWGNALHLLLNVDGWVPPVDVPDKFVKFLDSLPFDEFKGFPVAIQREWSRVELEYERLIKTGVSLPAATISKRQTQTALEVNELVEPMVCVDRGYSFDPDSRVLVWHGQAYPLTPNMADVVGVMFKAWERGRPEVSLDHLKGSVDSSALDHSLSKVFERRKGRDKFTDPVWGVIESVGKGVYRLADPRNP
jgi:hypothetical protein